MSRNVAFVIVGETAATAYGSSSFATGVLDLCYSRDSANLLRLAACLAPFHTRLRGAPEGLPFLWDEETLKRGLNFTLKTDLGDLNLLGEVAGVGNFDVAARTAIVTEISGVRCQLLSLNALIAAKRAAGRARDLEALPELEAIREALEPE